MLANGTMPGVADVDSITVRVYCERTEKITPELLEPAGACNVIVFQYWLVATALIFHLPIVLALTDSSPRVAVALTVVSR
ncbi:MAG TPA: hypothetical protein VM120_02450 [Bryobacteraceae bacterium]|nr:hypothetical protein [Bryobacteraceae bacterium]